MRYVESLFKNIHKQYNMLKLAYILRNLQNSRANNSRFFRNKNAKFLEYCFCINTNIKGDFHVSISVPLRGEPQSLQDEKIISIIVANAKMY